MPEELPWMIVLQVKMLTRSVRRERKRGRHPQKHQSLREEMHCACVREAEAFLPPLSLSLRFHLALVGKRPAAAAAKERRGASAHKH